MLGRLPLRYRVTVWVAGLVTFACFGAWLGLSQTVPIVWSAGAVVGAFLGAVAVTGFLRSFEGVRR